MMLMSAPYFDRVPALRHRAVVRKLEAPFNAIHSGIRLSAKVGIAWYVYTDFAATRQIRIAVVQVRAGQTEIGIR